MYCNKCGKPLTHNARFCEDCRRELETMLASDVPEPKPERRKRKALIAGLVVGSAVLLIVVAVILMLIQPWNQNAPQLEDSEPKEKHVYVPAESVTTYADGTQTREVYTYDENGHQVRKYSYLADGTCQEEVEYLCDASGSVIGTVTMEFGQITMEEAWEEDEDGNRLWYSSKQYRLKKPNEYWIVEQKNVYSYSHEKWIKTERYTAAYFSNLDDEGEQELHSYGEAKYHEGGMTATWYRADGSLMFTIEDIYDEDGKTVSRIHYNSEGLLYLKEMWSYSNSGKVSKYQRSDEEDKVEYIIEYAYDKRGNKIGESKKDAEGQTVYEIQHTYLRVDELPEEHIELRKNEES